MSFFSFYFVIFFIGFIILYWLFPKNNLWQKLVLLVSSTIFIGFNQYNFALFVLLYGLVIHIAHIRLAKLHIRELPLQIASHYKQGLLQIYRLYNIYIQQCNLEQEDTELQWQDSILEIYTNKVRNNELYEYSYFYEKLVELAEQLQEVFATSISDKLLQTIQKNLNNNQKSWKIIFSYLDRELRLNQEESIEFLQAIKQVLLFNSNLAELFYSNAESSLQLKKSLSFLDLNQITLRLIFRKVGFNVQALHDNVSEFFETKSRSVSTKNSLTEYVKYVPQQYNPSLVHEIETVPTLNELLSKETAVKQNNEEFDENSITHRLNVDYDYKNVSFLRFVFSSTLKQHISITDLLHKFSYKSGKLTLGLFVFIAVIPLIYFKAGEAIQDFYQNILIILGFDGLSQLQTIIPILGISYFTFNAITYLVSSFKGEIKQQSWLTTLVYISYFPTIVAGPIMRANFFVPQLNQVRCINSVNAIFYLLVRGVLKKWLLSTLLYTSFVQPVFESPDSYNSFELVFAAYAYGLRLYFDFSGYTDLMRAIGLSLGIKHYDNFDMPYISNNVKEFWRRWHISLSTWIRDYLYIVMGGNRHGFVKAQVFSLVAMLISGLWHGVTLNFIVWSLLHGVALVFLNLKARYFNFKLGTLISRLVTFNYVCFAWIFFASSEWDSAILFIKSIGANLYNVWTLNHSLIGMSLVLLYVVLQPVIYKTDQKIFTLITKKDNFLWIPLLLLVFIVILVLAPSGIPPFIYEDF